MGKIKNKTCRIDVRLTQEERDTLDNIVKLRGIGISDFLVKAIEEETKKVNEERSAAYHRMEQETANGEKQE